MNLYCVAFFFLFFQSSIVSLSATPSQGPVVLVVGTRPEAIKMLPIYTALKEMNIPTVLCSTGQHVVLLQEVLDLFQLHPDYNLKVMVPDQDLFHITTAVLTRAKEVLLQINPSLLVVQGDTTTAMAAALAAFYLKIPVAHVEAGLRTRNIYAPFPEEINRQLIGRIATFHFAPTPLAAKHLQEEHVSSEIIFCTGNTVIDALYLIQKNIRENKVRPSPKLSEHVEALRAQGKKLILLTAHRRESFGEGLKQIFSAFKTALEQNPNLFAIYPVHPNPAIQRALSEVGLDTCPNITILPPIPYHDLVYLLDSVNGVATDSGGIQEEAISLQKITLVLRNETDRPEGLNNGLGILVGVDPAKILEGIEKIMFDTSLPAADYISPYGDGLAGKRIAEIIHRELNKQ